MKTVWFPFEQHPGTDRRKPTPLWAIKQAFQRKQRHKQQGKAALAVINSSNGTENLAACWNNRILVGKETPLSTTSNLRPFRRVLIRRLATMYRKILLSPEDGWPRLLASWADFSTVADRFQTRLP